MVALFVVPLAIMFVYSFWTTKTSRSKEHPGHE